VRLRGGTPRFARRVQRGEPTTIVAFGTSITLGGQYLSALVPALTQRSGNDRIRLVNCGRRGFCTMMAPYRVSSDVLPAEPDLVVIEFAHNDLTPDAVRDIPAALHGIVAQLRAGRPGCECAFVYLAQPGTVAAGPTPAMVAYETVADYFGFPSIDLATPLEALVARGEAAWTGGDDALTSDGIHHTPAAAALLAEPFAAAFAQLLDPLPDLPVIPAISTPYEQAAWRPAQALIGSGEWAIGVPHGHASRNADAYADTVAQPLEASASLRFAFDGVFAFAWTMGSTMLETRYAGELPPQRFGIASGNLWAFTPLTPFFARGRHTVEVFRGDGEAVFGDIYVVGAFADADA
jgi:lysophospholipase L1-like esterase